MNRIENLVNYHHDMNNTTIEQITNAITGIKACQFASLTYLSKKAGELARYTVNLGFSYHKLVEKSITELEILTASESPNWTDLQKQAAAEIMASFEKTLEAHKTGEQNPDYTKSGQYTPLGNGININSTDGTIQLFGLLQSKVTLVEGTWPVVNSRPLTIAKNEIRKHLSISKFREFAVDLGQVAQVKVNGDTLELEPVLV